MKDKIDNMTNNLIEQGKEDYEKSPSARWAFRVCWLLCSLGLPILSYQNATLPTPDYSTAFLFVFLAAMFGWVPLFFETPVGKKLRTRLESKSKQQVKTD